jgi:hypothetical protein
VSLLGGRVKLVFFVRDVYVNLLVVKKKVIAKRCCGSGSRRAKMKEKNRKQLINLIF